MIWCGGVSHHCLQKPKDFCCWDWKRLSGESPQTCGTPDTYRLCVKLPAQNIYPNCEPDWNGSGSNMVIRLESGPTGLDSTALLDKHTLQLIALSHASILSPPSQIHSDSAHLMTPAAVRRPDVQTLQPAVKLLFHAKKTTWWNLLYQEAKGSCVLMRNNKNNDN